MYEEQRLISIGVPFSEAISICHSLRKEGGLEAYIKEQEQAYRETCASIVNEAID